MIGTLARVTRRFGPLAAVVAVGSAATLAPSPAAASIRAPKPLSPKSDQAKRPPVGGVNDRVLPLRQQRRARAASAVDGTGRGGEYTVTAGGRTGTVRIYLSKAFTGLDTIADKAGIDSINRGWAEEFVRMPHGAELPKLTVYLAPYSEITKGSVCGSEADSCYDPNDDTMYLVGETPPDGAGILQIAMHEYGHHVAAHRLNTPWDSLGWGPKHWASAQRVCSWVRRGRMWPFDQGDHYADNPGEIWAETYRIVSAKSQGLDPDPWEILNPRWDPIDEPAILAAAERDVTEPWRDRVRASWSGSFGTRTKPSTTVRIPVKFDGTLGTRLATSGSLRASVSLVPRGGSLRDGQVCGASRVDAVVTRKSGSGRWRLVARFPGA